MAQTPPTSITAAPSPAPQRNDRTTFSTRVDAFVTWLIAAVTQFNATATNVYNNAVDTYNNAISAAASSASALAAANVTGWVSGTTYAIGNNVWSPINFLTYRRKTAGAGTTDPSADSTNWEIIGGARSGVNSDITQLTALTSVVVSGSVAPIVVDNSTSGATKLQFKDAGSSIGVIGGSVSNPFIVMNTGLTDLFHVDVAGNLVPQGKLDLSVAGQIQFPATQNASANANCLDDYEEGTWTPAGVGVTFTSSAGTYTKIGNRCFIDCSIQFPANADAGAADINGLPFTIGSGASLSLGYTSTTTIFTPSLTTSNTKIVLYQLGGSTITNANMTAHNFWASGTYKV